MSTQPNTTDLDRLEALAKAATPGRWMRLFGERTVYDRMSDGCRGNAIVRADLAFNQQDAANLDFIAAANPAAILELIALARRSQPVAATKAAAPADAPELAKLRDRVAELEAMLDARLERKPDNSQEWAKVDGAIAFHLIERHADDWNDAGRMMDAWRDANPRRASSVPAIPGARRAAVLEEAAKVCDSMTKLSRENAERHKGPNGEDEDGYVDAYLNKAMASAQCAEGIRAIKVAAPSHPSDVNAGENQQ